MFGRNRRDIELSEPDIADACCDFIANRLNCMPQDVVVQLTFSDEDGFGADITVRGVRENSMQQLDLVDAIQEYVAERERYRSAKNNVTHVELQFSDHRGVYAQVRYL
ncbi:YxcD family protein [Alicyclobacillus fastidiosus]|uniref:YxcD family protein n=1 Tax=Alicyclobacillus fastidiosus TaxID=392011 RepID=A0ABY6ZJD3_9BACL|nr:DUF2653 family protein [Alicyclobacillus fastidiosus]WAH43007.1 YxcD family protein [Alicyclobacillus fastidiosus]GMA64977.1 hypothetical protein GCM10025859_54170 [Alicyclobacillus fastidiosus]